MGRTSSAGHQAPQKSRNPSTSFPALAPKLLELGQWIASYYVAPIGEVYRGMLPPLTELSAQQTVALTEAGAVASSSLFGESDPFVSLFQKLRDASDLPLQAALRAGVTLPDLLKLQRRGLVEIRQLMQNRKRRMQKIIARAPPGKAATNS